MTACTSCKQGTFKPSFLEPGLASKTCNYCGGNWLLIEDYVKWQQHSAEVAPSPERNGHLEMQDSREALLCPEGGGIMLKFRISGETSHRLDYSFSAGGIWLDKGEWELLVAEGLTQNLTDITTDSWQRRIREARATNTFKQQYVERFGQDDYQKAREFRLWLVTHDKKEQLKDYLNADNPYSAVE